LEFNPLKTTPHLTNNNFKNNVNEDRQTYNKENKGKGEDIKLMTGNKYSER